MAWVDLFEIKKHYDVKVLLEGVDFHLQEGERVALVGQNGCGKSTLMRIVAGSEEPDEGKRIVDGRIEIGMLVQQPHFEPHLRVDEAIEAQLDDLKAAKARYDALALQISEAPDNRTLLRELDETGAFLDRHNAWSLDDKIKRVMQAFDLESLKDRLVISLSGGEQRRVALASLILRKPDILLLDEPTNHLDVYMTAYLEELLLKERFTLLFVSHDRRFIDRIATRVVEIEDRKLVSYKGGYQSYLTQKEARIKAMQRAHENLLRLLKEEETWLSKSVRAREKRNQGRKARVLQLREEAKRNPSKIRKMKLELEREKKHFNRDKSVGKKKMLFELDHVSYSIADKQLLSDLSLRILQRDKIAIVGRNGSGKSTLLKLLLGRITPTGGTIKRGDFRIGYFDQHREMLDDDETLIGTFCPNGGDHVQVRGRNLHVYAYMKEFLFPEEYLTKKIGQLSGGEKNRVALALLFSKAYDCLILDEPTNDLDIQTITILEEQLAHFAGALIFVSHDRYFVDKLADKLLIFKGNGAVEESYQSYSDYLALEADIASLEAMEKEIEKVGTVAAPASDRVKKKQKLSYKEQRALETLPDEIEALEAKIDEINRYLSDPECYKEKGLQQLSETLAALQKEYDKKSDYYLELLELEESLSQDI